MSIDSLELNGKIVLRITKNTKMDSRRDGVYMRHKYSEIFRGLVGIILCLAAVAGIYYWEVYGRTEFTKKDIMVLKESVKPLTYITEDHLVVVKREVTTLIEDPVIDARKIMGQVSKHYIPSNVQLSDVYFESPGLLPQEGEYIFQIPPDWIASVPSTLRRSDDAFIYPVKYSKSKVDTGTIAETVHLTPEQTVDADAIKCLKIAFVKNQANQEVQSIGKTDRLDGTSSISTIEMIATLDDVKLLNSYREEGYKFMIMYR